MLSGFNTNVRHKGALFHVQTEDSGREHPHVITHLFHGGNILASEKQGYEQLLGEEDLESQVKRLMDTQHGSMLDQLRSGAHDAVIRERLGIGAAPDTTDRSNPPPAAPVASPRQAAATAPPRRAPAEPDPGAQADHQRPLDEVVLDYLLESARRRAKR